MITDTSNTALQATLLKLQKQVNELQKRVEELEKENAELRAENSVLKLENAKLRSENEELRRRLNQNSKNSNKPPSSDGLRKKPALPRKKGGIQGGQKNHIGKTLQQQEQPDFIVKHTVSTSTCECGKSLSSVAQSLAEKRQVFDLPVPRLEVTEHQIYSLECPCCGKQHRAEAPDHVKAPTQYGFGVKTFTTLLNNHYKLSFNKVSSLFADLFGCPINESTICSFNRQAFNQLGPSIDKIAERLMEEVVVHADETGLRIEGKLQWLHTIASALYTRLFVHPKRGTKALESDESLLPHLRNYLVHDCWASYFQFNQVEHVVCGAHLLRELEALIENDTQWAKQFKEFLLMLYQKEHPLIQNHDFIYDRYDVLCQCADLEEPPPWREKEKGKYKNTKGRNLLNRLVKHKDAVLKFTFVEEVPFTNNLAERDIRPTKLKQKVSGCFRTFQGAQVYARIESFLSTVKKHGKNVFDELKETIETQSNFLFEATPAK